MEVNPGQRLEMEGDESFFFFCLDRVINVWRFDRNRSMPVSHSQQTGSLGLKKKNFITLLVSRFLFPFWMLKSSPPRLRAFQRNGAFKVNRGIGSSAVRSYCMYEKGDLFFFPFIGWLGL